MPRYEFDNTAGAQIRPRYNSTNYADLTVGSGGDLTIAPTGLDTNITGRLAVSSNVTVGGTLGVTGATTVAAITASGTLTAQVGVNLASSGANGVRIGTSTSNAKNTRGLTIQQGAADDEFLSGKSSDVAHGMTDLAETDTYAAALKIGPVDGGLWLRGFSEGEFGLISQAYVSVANTVKSTAGIGAVELRAALKSLTTAGSMGADANLVVIRDNSTTRFIFDAEGDAHADVSWTTFDGHDDLVVIEDLETHLAGSTVQRRFSEVVRHDRGFFEREGLLHDVREVGGRMRGMLNTTRGLMLSFGAIRQVGGEARALRGALQTLLDRNPTLVGASEARALLG